MELIWIGIFLAGWLFGGAWEQGRVERKEYFAMLRREDERGRARKAMEAKEKW